MSQAASRFTGRVRGGRLRVDVPCRFAEGTTLELTLADPGDDLDRRERQALHAAIRRAWASVQQGKWRTVGSLKSRLAAGRSRTK